MRLTAARGVEGAAVEGDLPQRSPPGARDFANVRNVRVKFGDGRVSVVKPVSHAGGYSIRLLSSFPERSALRAQAPRGTPELHKSARRQRTSGRLTSRIIRQD